MDEESEKIIEENLNNVFEKSTILFVRNYLKWLINMIELLFWIIEKLLKMIV